MANKFTHICPHVVLHNLPLGYSTRLRKFYGERGYLAEENMGWFSDWVDLEEVDHDDVKVILFSQILLGEARKWYKNLTYDYILSYQTFVFQRQMGRSKESQAVSISVSFHEEEGEQFYQRILG